MPATRRTRSATTKATPNTTTPNNDVSTPNSHNTLSHDKRPSTKGPGKRGQKRAVATDLYSDAKVNEGLGPAVGDKKASGHQDKVNQGPKGGRLNTPVKSVVPTRTLPSRPGRNIHPAGQPKTRRSKEQIEANCEASVKILEEKMHEVRVVKEHLAQLNLMEEHEEDDLPNLHPQCLSTAIHKRHHVDVEADSDDECFDLREADGGSIPDDSPSKSDKAAKTKASSRDNKRIKGAARRELMARTEDLRGVGHIEKTQRQKPTHDIERFTAQDLRCKKYANSGLQPQALVPPGAAPTHAPLQWSDVADPFELGGLGNSDLEETCPAMAEVQSLVSDKPPRLVRIRMKADVYQGEPQAMRMVLKSKAAKAVVKKDASLKGHVSSKRVTEAHPNITCQCLDDTCWTRIFLPTLSHALYLSDHLFSDWARESSALVKTVQHVFDLSFTNISYTLGPQDGIVKAAYDQMKTQRSKIASDVLSLVKTFFERAEFNGKPEKIREYVHWALCSGGPVYYKNPVPKSTSKLRKGDPNYAKPDGFLRSHFILPVAETYMGFASRSVLHPSLGSKNPPMGLYAMILTAVKCVMRAHLTGGFNVPGDFNHRTTWNSMNDFSRILDQVSEPRWAQALDFVDCEMENRMDESLLSAYCADFHLSPSPTKSGV
ncbi:hypothetical protein BJY52DRAFT_1195572 [Lactarius psammicola]|nr:hypothetical protein BJY52DRAFT_1195572 [Lactarius psammicola]